jgi:hypothetical protein
MKSDSSVYAHQSVRSPNLEIPRMIGENVAAQTRELTLSSFQLLVAGRWGEPSSRRL